MLTLDLSGMVAGSKYRGEFEERIKRVVSEVISDGNVLLFLDELHTIIGAGGAEGAIDASNILKPSLARGELQLIGATTREEYRKYIEKDAALDRIFLFLLERNNFFLRLLHLSRRCVNAKPHLGSRLIHHVDLKVNACGALSRRCTGVLSGRRRRWAQWQKRYGAAASV